MEPIRFETFSKMEQEERLSILRRECLLTEEECGIIESADSLAINKADKMIESVVGRFALPLGIATGVCVNGKHYYVPMVTEEPSLVSACSRGAEYANVMGGFSASYSGSLMISQIELTGVAQPEKAKELIVAEKKKIAEICNQKDPILLQAGGGVRDVEVRVMHSAIGILLVVHLIVDVKDVIGANLLNGMAEEVSPFLESISGGRASMRILSNLADRRIVTATAVFEKETIGGAEVVERIVEAYAFANADPYRATTNNKGIMNGIVPVAIATGNDTRAIEAAAHVYACRSGQCRPLAKYEKTSSGDLKGMIEMPMPVATVGGTIKLHPAVRVNQKIMGITSAGELAQVMASMGLSLNLIATRSLVTGGIQRAHMLNHARSVAASVGAEGEAFERIVSQMVRENNIHTEYAEKLLKQML